MVKHTLDRFVENFLDGHARHEEMFLQLSLIDRNGLAASELVTLHDKLTEELDGIKRVRKILDDVGVPYDVVVRDNGAFDLKASWTKHRQNRAVRPASPPSGWAAPGSTSSLTRSPGNQSASGSSVCSSPGLDDVKTVDDDDDESTIEDLDDFDFEHGLFDLDEEEKP